MATTCAYCGAADMLTGLDRNQCMACGRFTDIEGNRTVPTAALADDWHGNEYAGADGQPPAPGTETAPGALAPKADEALLVPPATPEAGHEARLSTRGSVTSEATSEAKVADLPAEPTPKEELV